MIKKKYIVAGTYEQYRQFLYNHKDDINVEYIYVQSVNNLKGLSNIEGFLIGTYYNRPDIVAIMDTIRIIKSKQTEYIPAENAVYGNVTGYRMSRADYDDNPRYTIDAC